MDEAELRERLRALENRVAQLEGLLAERPSPAPPRPGPATVPPPAPRLDASVGSPFAPPPPSPRPPSEPEAAFAEPPPLPGADRRRAGTTQAPPRDYERFLGLAVLGRVGIGAVLMAAAYFGQLGWRHLGPGARAALVYVAGLLLIGAGAWLRPRVAARYVAMLWGGGVAMTWLAGVLGYLRFAVLSSPVAIVSMLASAALGQWLARVLGLQSIATVALAGAYAAPVLVGTPSPTPTAFFTLLLTLHTWAAWTEHRWQWQAARALAVVATIGLVWSWYAQHGTGGVRSFVPHVLVVWLALAAPELLAGLRRRPVDELRAALVGLGHLVASFACLAVVAAGRVWLHVPVLLALAALAAGTALRSRAMPLGTWLARAGSCLLAFGFALWSWEWHRRVAPGMQPAWYLAGLLAIASGLLLTRRFTGVGELGAALAAWLSCSLLVTVRVGSLGSDELRRYAVAAIAVWLWSLVAGQWAAARLLGLFGGAVTAYLWLRSGGHFGQPQGGWLAVALAGASGVGTLGAYVAARDRDRLLAWCAAGVHAAVLLGWFSLAWRTRAAGVDVAGTPLWNARTGALLAMVVAAWLARRRLPVDDAPPRAVLGATALAGIYCAGLLELLEAVAGLAFGPRAVASSLYTLVFAGLLLVAGFRRQLPALRWTALVAFVVVVVKVLAHDLREVDTPVRVLATGALGGVLLVAAWAYARRARGAG